MWRFLKIVLVLILILGGGLYALANYSFTEAKLRCDAVTGPTPIIFVRLQLYRPIVKLWSESDGNAWVETDQGFYYYFSELDSNEFYVQIRSAPGDLPTGEYSFVSQRINIEIAGNKFRGSCVEL